VPLSRRALRRSKIFLDIITSLSYSFFIPLLKHLLRAWRDG
jgi:hypothetical protein